MGASNKRDGPYAATFRAIAAKVRDQLRGAGRPPPKIVVVGWNSDHANQYSGSMISISSCEPFSLPDVQVPYAFHRDRVSRSTSSVAPGFASSVEHMEVLAPPDIEERFGLLGGNIMQGELTPDQMFSLRPIPGYGDYRTPIEGMYLCGGGTHPGGGVMGIPGRNASTVILKDHRRARLFDRVRGVVG